MSDYHDLTINKPIIKGVILQRFPDGVESNVPHLVTHHSPSGFEWGYEGSGPADLALNVLEWALLEMGYTGRKVDCYQGQCFDLAWILHQDFKRELIAKVPKEGGVIPYPAITAWINNHWPKEYKTMNQNQQESDLLEAAKMTLALLNHMTTESFSKGEDKPARAALGAAIAELEGQEYEPEIETYRAYLVAPELLHELDNSITLLISVLSGETVPPALLINQINTGQEVIAKAKGS